MKVKTYLCEKCGKNFKHRQSRYKHQLICGNKDIIFELSYKCSYKTIRKDTLQRHKRNCKGEKPELRCTTCYQLFQYKSYLKRHEESHQKAELVCKCNRKYARKDHFQNHLATCNLEKKTLKFNHKQSCGLERSASFENLFVQAAEDLVICQSLLTPQELHETPAFVPSMALEDIQLNQIVPSLDYQTPHKDISPQQEFPLQGKNRLS